MCAAVAAPCLAQRPHVNRVQNRPANRPPNPPKQQAKQQQKKQAQKQAQAERRQNGTANRPPAANTNQAGARTNNSNPNRPPSANTPTPRKFDSLPRQEQQKILQSHKDFEKLNPTQKQEMQDRARVWSQMTPAQRDHIKNDVIPKWRQMPVERRQAIRQRLQILQNMPESARNQHLNDPNFTRGMNEEDKATLRDLSHMHVGGAPDPPSE